MTENVCIIVVNWNAWRETIECLESVLRMEYSRFTVILCDNGSSDDSMSHIRAWAKLGTWDRAKVNHALVYLTSPPVKKPLIYAEYKRSEAEEGGDRERGSGTRLVFIELPTNL